MTATTANRNRNFFSLPLRLFLVLLIFASLLVGTMAMATRWNVRNGLLSYIIDSELARLTPLIEALAKHYRKEGNWDAMAMPPVWSHLVESSLSLPEYQPPKPARNDNGNEPSQPPMDWRPPGPGFGPSGNVAPPPQPRGPSAGNDLLDPLFAGMEGRIFRGPMSDPSGLMTRLQLFDADQNAVAGLQELHKTSGFSVLPIKVDGDTVGWLRVAYPPVAVEGLEGRFLQEQLEGLIWIAGVALLLAVLAAALLGRGLVQPILSLGSTVRHLADGKFQARVKGHRRDELGALGDDINRLGQALERNEKLRRDSMADISHELRTPLALLRANIEAMQDEILPTDSGQLQRLHDIVLQLNRLIDDLHDMALADSGSLRYQFQTLDGGALLRDALAAARPALAEAGLSLQQDIDQPLMMRADERRIRQVFDNLINNSIRYTDAPGTISVRARAANGRAEIRFEDSAPGVPTDSLPRLFERLYRVERSRNRALGGAGIGLALVKLIVEVHEGDVGADTSTMGGLAITLHLPLQESKT